MWRRISKVVLYGGREQGGRKEERKDYLSHSQSVNDAGVLYSTNTFVSLDK